MRSLKTTNVCEVSKTRDRLDKTSPSMRKG